MGRRPPRADYATPYRGSSAAPKETLASLPEKLEELQEEALLPFMRAPLAGVPDEDLGRISERSGTRRSACRSSSLRKPLQYRQRPR